MTKQRTPLLKTKQTNAHQQSDKTPAPQKLGTPARTASTPAMTKNDTPMEIIQKPSANSSKIATIARGIGDQSTPVHYIVVTMDGLIDRVVIPLAEVVGPKCGSYFSNFGIALDKAEIADIRNFARTTGPNDIKYDIQTRVGFNGTRFAFPFMKGVQNAGEAKGDRKWLQHFPDKALLADFKTTGSLETWQELTKFAKGNSRLIFLLALALTGPLSGLLGHLPLNFLLYGAQGGGGKTSLAAIASSVWGWNSDDFGFGQSCNVTSIGLQSFLASRRHALAVIDEPATSEDKKKCAQLLLGLAFLAASGAGRVRQRQDDSIQVERTEPMETAVIITSNYRVEEIVQWAGSTAASQHHDRMITIAAPADAAAGFFETLHEESSLSSLIDKLKRIARLNHGVAGKRLLQELEAVWTRDAERFKAAAKKLEDKYLETCSEFASDDSLQRLKRSFARVYVAGCFGISAKVLLMSRSELLAAVLKCHRDCLPHRVVTVSDRGGVIDHDAAFQKVTHFWAENCKTLPRLNDGRFDKSNPPPHDQAFISVEKSRRYLALTDGHFVELCGGKPAADALKVHLAAKGVLLREKSGNSTPRYVVKRQVGMELEMRFVLISTEAFDETMEDF